MPVFKKKAVIPSNPNPNPSANNSAPMPKPGNNKYNQKISIGKHTFTTVFCV